MGKEVPTILLTMERFVKRGDRVDGSEIISVYSFGILIHSLGNCDLKI